MSKQEADILLIRKYLNGELDARAMHRLERRAQDDPFLMDAIDGYEHIKNNQQANLDNLAARLQQRTSFKESRIIPWRMLGIAASILVVFTIGGLLLFKSQKPAPEKLAQLPAPEVKTQPAAPSRDSVAMDNAIAALPPAPHYQLRPKRIRPVIGADKVAEVSQVQPNPLASAEVSADEAAAPADTDTSSSLAEMVVMDMSKKNKDVVKSKRSDTLARDKAYRQPNINTVLLGKVEGVKASPADGKTTYGYFDSSSRTRIQGRVIDKMDGMPLPGVSVRVAGTKTATLTDADGLFKLSVDSSKTKLNIGFIGYETVNVNVSRRDSLKTITMVPSHNALSEVVVVGYGSKKTDEDAVFVDAYPKNGWGSLKKYLKENAKSPDGKIGTVKLSFTIDRDGGIDDVVVVKGLSPAANKKAVDLLSDGPEWIGNSSGKTEKLTLRIKFTK